MILKITQKIIYEIDGTINFGFNKLLLTPQNNESQKILDWKINIEGGSKELNSIDQFGNLIDLVSIQNNSKKIVYNIFGKVETKSNFGIKQISKKEEILLKDGINLIAATPKIPSVGIILEISLLDKFNVKMIFINLKMTKKLI